MGLLSTLRAEAGFLARTAWRALWRCGAACLLLAMGFVLYVLITAEPPPGRPPQTWAASDVLAALVAAAAYGAYLAFFPALIASGLYVAYALTGPWILFPVVVIPACVALSLWGFSGLLDAEVAELWEAIRAAASTHDWAVLGIGPLARAGPVALVVALPLLVIDLGVLAVQPAVLIELLSLAAWVAVACLVGLVPAGGASAVVLLLAYLVRLRRRGGQPAG